MRALRRLFPYVRRTIVRAPLRATLTVLGTALAMGLFTFVRMLEGGVDRVHILNGETPHTLLLELFTKIGTGTLLTLEAQPPGYLTG